MRIQNLDHLFDLRETGFRMLYPDVPLIGVGMGTCGIGNGADAVYAALAEVLKAKGVAARLRPVGCFGFCAAEPLVNIRFPNQPLVIYQGVRPADAEEIVAAIAAGRLPDKTPLCKIEEWDHITRTISYGHGCPEIPVWHEVPFYRGQKKIVLRNCGLIDPESIEEYMAVGGYNALFQALQKPNRIDVIEEVKRSKLRGRGGAGYPTGIKWSMLEKAQSDVKYLICNADEGDPGAYMNRNEIEGDPHMLIEGMLIGAYATGANRGIVYLRAEYPLAVKRLQRAVEEAREFGLLGEAIFGTDFAFDIQLVEGAGAFVCGEETAMIASLEGKPGRPRPRPPYPAEKGLWGKPTNINNVETWANIPVIVARGGAWFAATGTANSSGTKVFSLVGKVANTGLVEMPLGTSLQHIIYEAGQGSNTGKPVKAVQTGGPSGGCIPARYFDTPVDYESLAAIGAIMGSGGMVVMDEDTCMVDVARYFIEFSHSESCGKCVPCRVGLDQALTMLNRVTAGDFALSELGKLEELAEMIKVASLCGLGQTAPNPVLTTLRYFRNEYIEHIVDQRCSSGVCEPLFAAPCENSCPLHMRIPGYLQMLKQKQVEPAIEMVWRDNPLPGSTGRVCLHPCERRCRRADMDAPVNMRAAHRYLADEALTNRATLAALTKTLVSERLPATGKRVAIVGAGPAGLTAAFYLAMLGHAVKVVDARPEPGGMLRYALPAFRLPRAVLDAEIGVIRALGVQFVMNSRLGGELGLEELEKGHDAVFLAIGATASRAAEGLSGAEYAGVLQAADVLDGVSRGDAPATGKRVAVVGGGLSALDVARTLARLGAEVRLHYRRGRADMRVPAADLAEAEAEGVSFDFHAAATRILDEGTGRVTGLALRRTTPGAYDPSGRREAQLDGEPYTFNCDTVILALGKRPRTDILAAKAISLSHDGHVGTDPITMKTDRPRVYAGGDVVDRNGDVVGAMGAAKKAARDIDRVLMGADRMARVLKHFDYRMIVPATPKKIARFEPATRSAGERRGDFDEVALAVTLDDAMAEGRRCLRCDVKDRCVHQL